jgi:hypothetical protein
VFPILISFVFPPFGIAYFFCYLSASHFGMSAESGFRAKVR